MEKRENVYYLTSHELLVSLVESDGELPPKEAVEIRDRDWVVVNIDSIMEPADFENAMKGFGIDFVDNRSNSSSNP